jgi:hypothetical protein
MNESLQSKLEAELFKLKSENAIIIGKKIVPDVAKRLADLFGVDRPMIAEVTDDMVKEYIKHNSAPQTALIPVNPYSDKIFFSILEKIKERLGATPAWRIPEDEYLAIVEECRKVQ